MESFGNWHEHSPLDPQELSLLHNCSTMTLYPKTLSTNFPAGWEGMGRNGLQQLGCTSDGLPSFLVLHPECSLLHARSTYTWSIRKSWTLILGQCPLLPIPCQPAGKFVSKFLGFKGIIEQFCNKESSWGSNEVCSFWFSKLSIEPPQSYKDQKSLLLSK